MAPIGSLEKRVFGVVLVLATVAFLFLIHDFLLPAFWAALLATLFFPLNARLRHRWRGHASSCATVVVSLIVISVILPASLVSVSVMRQSSLVFKAVQAEKPFAAGDSLQKVRQALQPMQSFLDRLGIDLTGADQALTSSALAAGEFMANHALAFGQNALLFGVQCMAMLYLLFFFVRDGDQLVERLIEYLPMGDARERRLLVKFSQMATATVKGTLVVACVQGALGGLAFGILGIPGAVLWGAIMAALSLMPAFGAALVWLPASLWLLAMGATGKALGLALFGFAVIGLVDNFLRPVLVSHDTNLPDYIVLVATFGGIAVLGPSGFAVGPITAALCVTGWRMLKNDLEKVT